MLKEGPQGSCPLEASRADMNRAACTPSVSGSRGTGQALGCAQDIHDPSCMEALEAETLCSRSRTAAPSKQCKHSAAVCSVGSSSISRIASCRGVAFRTAVCRRVHVVQHIRLPSGLHIACRVCHRCRMQAQHTHRAASSPISAWLQSAASASPIFSRPRLRAVSSGSTLRMPPGLCTSRGLQTQFLPCQQPSPPSSW